MGKTPSNTDVCFWRDPDLPGVEVRYSSYHQEAFCKHTHADYSIGYIDTGRTTFSLDGEDHTATAENMVFIPPEMVHACNPDLDTVMTYHMFYVAPAWLESVAAEVFGDGVGVPAFPRPVVDDPDLLAHWRALHLAIAEGAGKLEKESMLVQGLADLLSRHTVPTDSTAPVRDDLAVGKVKQFLADNVAEKVNLDTLSEIAHLSRYHLLRVFQEAVGLPPHAYQNQLRVDLGKRLLASGMPISRAAVEAGFVDQSHFSRVFKQFTGATPRQYQTSLNPA